MTGKLHISKFKFETRNSNHACVCRPRTQPSCTSNTSSAACDAIQCSLARCKRLFCYQITHAHSHTRTHTWTGTDSELISMLTHARQQFCYAYVLLAMSASRRSGLAGKKCLPLLHTLMKLMFPSRTEQGIDGATEHDRERVRVAKGESTSDIQHELWGHPSPSPAVCTGHA